MKSYEAKGCFSLSEENFALKKALEDTKTEAPKAKVAFIRREFRIEESS